MKRGRGDALTGGTGDVNPQIFRLNANVSLTSTLSAGGFTTKSQRTIFPLPINRVRDPSGKTNVIEITKTRWSVSLTETPTSGAWSANVNSYIKTSPSPGDSAISDLTTVVDYIVQDIWEQPSTFVTVPDNPVQVLQFDSSKNDFPIIHDLTDGAGHGILVATDNIYLATEIGLFSQVFGGGPTIAFSGNSRCQIDVEIFYRFKSVTLQEYIGIVQSQQNPAGGSR